MKKKILFILSNPSQFKNFFRNKIDYLNDKYYGLISQPSSVFLESQIYNYKIKLISTKQNKYTSSGALKEFYKKNKNICWKINNINLRNYLNNSFKTHKNNFRSGFDFKKAIEKNIR